MSREKCISRPRNRNSDPPRRVHSCMRMAMALAIACVAAAPAPDAHTIVERSLTANDENWKVARNYTFLERVEERRLDAAGHVQSKEVKTYDVTLLEGSPYERLVERDDHPLSPAEEKKEQEKLAKSIAERMKETPAERERRIADFEKRRKREQDAMREVGDAFDFKIAGQDRVDGRDVWILDATPRREYHPRSRDAKVLPHVRGRLWIDQQTYHWVKLDAEVIDPVTWGLFLVRLDKGAHVQIDETRVNDEVWLPRWISITASARLGIFKHLRVQQETTYKNFRKFRTDSRMVENRF
jgi:hypothetical protein